MIFNKSTGRSNEIVKLMLYLYLYEKWTGQRPFQAVSHIFNLLFYPHMPVKPSQPTHSLYIYYTCICGSKKVKPKKYQNSLLYANIRDALLLQFNISLYQYMLSSSLHKLKAVRVENKNLNNVKIEHASSKRFVSKKHEIKSVISSIALLVCRLLPLSCKNDDFLLWSVLE